LFEGEKANTTAKSLSVSLFLREMDKVKKLEDKILRHFALQE